MNSLKHGWQTIVTASDYDLHMSNVGQAQANAALTLELLQATQIPSNSHLKFAGAGTGQMFDFADFSVLNSFKVTFTDINADFLDQLSNRAQTKGIGGFETLVEDVEIATPADTVVLVLVLEHVDWRKALRSLAGAPRLLTITQENPPEFSSAVTPGRVLPESLVRAMEGEKPTLLAEHELAEAMQDLGFTVSYKQRVDVPDGKVMRGAVWVRGA